MKEKLLKIFILFSEVSKITWILIVVFFLVFITIYNLTSQLQLRENIIIYLSDESERIEKDELNKIEHAFNNKDYEKALLSLYALTTHKDIILDYEIIKYIKKINASDASLDIKKRAKAIISDLKAYEHITQEINIPNYLNCHYNIICSNFQRNSISKIRVQNEYYLTLINEINKELD